MWRMCTHWKKEKEKNKANNPKCPSVVDWIKAIWYSLTVVLELYSNENEIQLQGTKWGTFQHIMLSGINQIKRSTCWIILFRQNSRAGKADSWCDHQEIGYLTPEGSTGSCWNSGSGPFWSGYWLQRADWFVTFAKLHIFGSHTFLNLSYNWIGSLLEKILERYYSLWGKLPEWELRFSDGSCLGALQNIGMGGW